METLIRDYNFYHNHKNYMLVASTEQPATGQNSILRLYVGWGSKAAWI